MKHTSTFKVRWADVDANAHLRHSAYADYCAQARVELLEKVGLNAMVMHKLGIGPILFREELIYKKEVAMSETITVQVKLASGRKDGSRWGLSHQVFRQNGDLAAEVTVEGAWMDVRKRKLGTIPEEFAEKMAEVDKVNGFVWAD